MIKENMPTIIVLVIGLILFDMFAVMLINSEINKILDRIEDIVAMSQTAKNDFS